MQYKDHAETFSLFLSVKKNQRYKQPWNAPSCAIRMTLDMPQQ